MRQLSGIAISYAIYVASRRPAPLRVDALDIWLHLLRWRQLTFRIPISRLFLDGYGQIDKTALRSLVA